MRLFGVEVTRLAARRLIRWVVLLFLAGIALTGVLVYVNNEGSFRRSEMGSALIGMALPLTMLGWLVGATSIGAEWGPRTITALLTWDPRRGVVLATKAAAAASLTAILVVLLEMVFTAAVLPGAAAVADDPLVWEDYVATGGRIAVVAVLASAFGFGLATIGKNTGAALGGGMAYLLIVENLVRAYKPGWTDWLLGSNIGRVIEGGDGFGLAERTTTGATGLLALYALALFALALWVFRRREMA